MDSEGCLEIWKKGDEQSLLPKSSQRTVISKISQDRVSCLNNQEYHLIDLAMGHITMGHNWPEGLQGSRHSG